MDNSNINIQESLGFLLVGQIYELNARLITNFGDFIFYFFRYFGCVIFFTLNFRFACLALLNKKSEQNQVTKMG